MFYRTGYGGGEIITSWPASLIEGIACLNSEDSSSVATEWRKTKVLSERPWGQAIP